MKLKGVRLKTGFDVKGGKVVKTTKHYDLCKQLTIAKSKKVKVVSRRGRVK